MLSGALLAASPDEMRDATGTLEVRLLLVRIDPGEILDEMIANNGELLGYFRLKKDEANHRVRADVCHRAVFTSNRRSWDSTATVES